MSNDFTNALEVSRMRLSSSNGLACAQVAKAVAAGRFAVIHTYPAYCPLTDAIAGSHRSYHADFATRELAEAEVAALYASGQDSEAGWEVLPARTVEAPVLATVGGDDEDCPF